MKKLLILFLLFSLFSCGSDSTKKTNLAEKTTYFFIRHAEKDRSDKTNKNPKLTEKGIKRAQKWAKTLKNIHFDAIYSTNYERTKETALPTAIKNNLELTFYNPRDMDYELFKRETKGKTVLVVGHSNTTPSFVNKILDKNKYEDIDDGNNANLYIITILGDTKNDKLLYID